MYAKAQTWWTILKICFEERLVYRGDFALGTLMRFLPIVTQIFLWGAVFTSLKSGGDVAGYNFDNIIAYYLLTMVARAFSSMPGLASGIAREIREGTIKKFLIQPIDMIGFLLLNRMAHKLVYYGVAIGPFALVFYLCRNFFPPLPDGPTIAAFVASLLMAFLLGFFLEATIGLIGFWFLEVSSLLFVYMLFNFFFSGHMFPLDMLPNPADDGSASNPFAYVAFFAVEALPLKYLAYFPSAIWLGKVEGDALTRGLWSQAGWVVLFVLVSRLAFERGVRRYSGYGG